MLVLVTGVTGNLGLHLIESLSSRGHKVRGLGRSPDKLTEEQRSKLESFVEIQNYWDVDALDRACNGVDAVICAYAGTPVMHLDAQLLLLRTAERAGISRFLAASWNCDWRQLQLDMHQSYDACIAFDAPEGGFWELHSGAYSPRELAKIYKVRGIEITFKERGSLDDLRELAYSMREQKPYNDYYGFIGLFYQLFQLDGTYSLKNLDNEKLKVKTTSMEEFLRKKTRYLDLDRQSRPDRRGS